MTFKIRYYDTKHRSLNSMWVGEGSLLSRLIEIGEENIFQVDQIGDWKFDIRGGK